uniref:Uncharacterized protein n=1 Tax=Anopheles culicifacies TaxID=139723 RepID=A0A182MRS5_9DIPT
MMRCLTHRDQLEHEISNTQSCYSNRNLDSWMAFDNLLCTHYLFPGRPARAPTVDALATPRRMLRLRFVTRPALARPPAVPVVGSFVRFMPSRLFTLPARVLDPARLRDRDRARPLFAPVCTLAADAAPRTRLRLRLRPRVTTAPFTVPSRLAIRLLRFIRRRASFGAMVLRTVFCPLRPPACARLVRDPARVRLVRDPARERLVRDPARVRLLRDPARVKLLRDPARCRFVCEFERLRDGCRPRDVLRLREVLRPRDILRPRFTVRAAPSREEIVGTDTHFRNNLPKMVLIFARGQLIASSTMFCTIAPEASK